MSSNTTNAVASSSSSSATPSKSMKPITSDVISTSSSSGSTSSSSTGSGSGTGGGISSFKLMLLILMVIQNSSVVLVGRYTRANIPKEDLYVVNHLIIVTEGMKCICSLILEYFATKGQLLKSIKNNIIDTPIDALKISVPALLYLIQNTLLYVALSNLSAPLFQVTYQCKLVTTAIVSVFMLNRKYSIKQWICLILISFGVALVVLAEASSNSNKSDNNDNKDTMSSTEAKIPIINEEDEDLDENEEGTSTTTRLLLRHRRLAEDNEDNENNNNDSPPVQSLSVGLFAVSIACFSSALAGVYFEKVVKKMSGGAKEKAPVSLWMRNVQLAFFSVCIAIFQYITNTNEEENSKSFGHGFTFWVYIVIMLQALGGLLVAAVIKYADNVLKGLATGVSVVSSTLASIILFGTTFTIQFVIGSIIILISVYFFTNKIPISCLLCLLCSSNNDHKETIQRKDSGANNNSNNNKSSSTV